MHAYQIIGSIRFELDETVDLFRTEDGASILIDVVGAAIINYGAACSDMHDWEVDYVELDTFKRGAPTEKTKPLVLHSEFDGLFMRIKAGLENHYALEVQDAIQEHARAAREAAE